MDGREAETIGEYMARERGERGENTAVGVDRVTPPIDRVASWLDQSQDRMAMTLDKLEASLASILSESRPLLADDREPTPGESALVRRFAMMASREDDLIRRLESIIDRVEV